MDASIATFATALATSLATTLTTTTTTTTTIAAIALTTTVAATLIVAAALTPTTIPSTAIAAILAIAIAATISCEERLHNRAAYSLGWAGTSDGLAALGGELVGALHAARGQERWVLDAEGLAEVGIIHGRQLARLAAELGEAGWDRHGAEVQMGGNLLCRILPLLLLGG